MSDSGSPQNNKAEEPAQSEHLNIKVTDNNNEVFFKIKRTTQLKKLMDAFCERQGKSATSVRFLFDGQRVNPTDNPDSVSWPLCLYDHFLAKERARRANDFSSTWKMAIPSRFTRNKSEVPDYPNPFHNRLFRLHRILPIPWHSTI